MAKKTGKVKVGIKDAGPKHVKTKKPVGKPPKRIRMLMTLANQHGAWQIGESYDVPHEVPVDSARRWLASGAAEEDKSLPDPPEHG